MKQFKFFQNMYGEKLSPIKSLPPSSFPKLKDLETQFLSKPILDEEIKNACFYMGL